MVEDFERLDEFGRGLHRCDATACKERGVRGAISCERCGVGGGNQRSGLALSGLQCDDALALAYGLEGDRGESLWFADRLDEHADRCHAVVCDEGLQDVLDATACLVADGDHVGHLQSALLEREVEADVAALGDHTDPTIDARAAVLVRPESDPIEGVHVAVAVRSEKCHVAGGDEELFLQVDVTGLGEPRRVTHCAPCAECAKLCDGIDRQVSVDRDEGCVGNAGEVGDRGEAHDSVHVGLLRMHGPDLTRVAELLALTHDSGSRCAADHRDGSRIEESCEVGHC